MTVKLLNISTFFRFIPLTFAIWAFAYAGPGDRGGGDLTVERKFSIAAYVEEDLKQDAINFSKHLSSDRVLSSSLVEPMKKMLSGKQLEETIKNAPLVLKDNCVDQDGKSIYASTIIGKKGAEICFNLDFLARDNANVGDLILLLLHEIAHQFGWDPQDNHESHSFSKVLAISRVEMRRFLQPLYKFSKLEWIPEGDLQSHVLEEFLFENPSSFILAPTKYLSEDLKITKNPINMWTAMTATRPEALDEYSENFYDFTTIVRSANEAESNIKKGIKRGLNFFFVQKIKKDLILIKSKKVKVF